VEDSKGYSGEGYISASGHLYSSNTRKARAERVLKRIPAKHPGKRGINEY
jgi:hypothetical protein